MLGVTLVTDRCIGLYDEPMQKEQYMSQGSGAVSFKGAAERMLRFLTVA